MQAGPVANPVEGAVAIVTGGGTGVGRAVCLALAARGASAVVVTYSRSAAEAEAVAVEVREAGCRSAAVCADVRDESAIAKLIESTVADFGGIDILVNNAGATRLIPFGDLDAVTDEDWDLVLGVNIKGAFAVTRAAAAELRKSRGSVVNVASIAGSRAIGTSIPYGVSKAGLMQLTRGLALALAPEVRVNSVSPGSIVSRWLGDLVGEDAARQRWEKESKVIPLGAVATAEDVAQAIVALIDARFVTGQDIVVDGGKHLLY